MKICEKDRKCKKDNASEADLQSWDSEHRNLKRKNDLSCAGRRSKTGHPGDGRRIKRDIGCGRSDRHVHLSNILKIRRM